MYLLYWNFLPRLGKLLNTRWNFELERWRCEILEQAHGTSTNPFEEGRSTEKLDVSLRKRLMENKPAREFPLIHESPENLAPIETDEKPC